MIRTKKIAAVRECSKPPEPWSRQSSQSDEELLLHYRSTGDRSAFAELVHRYERELYNYLRRHLGDGAMAEDVFQATFLLVHLKCKQFDAGRPFRPWLYAVALHAAIDAQRRDKRHRSVSLERSAGGRESPRLSETIAGNLPGPCQQLVRRENSDWVRAAVAQLSEQMRSAVELVYYQGLKYREAAEILGVPAGTVKSRLNAAVQKLSEWWNQSRGIDAQP